MRQRRTAWAEERFATSDGDLLVMSGEASLVAEGAGPLS
jgi:hypothetical protein